MTPPKATLRELYEGDTPGAHRFRYALLVFDVRCAPGVSPS
jgi:voltage-gated potassium channel